jgi:hypothetical protein
MASGICAKARAVSALVETDSVMAGLVPAIPIRDALPS